MTTPHPPPIGYEVTGRAAHSRIAPLLPQEWVDAGYNKEEKKQENVNATPQFLWENAPRHETKGYRDDVRCYSHLPNGLSVLDSKWALARLFATSGNKNDKEEEAASTLATHCFRGVAGFQRFCDKVGMFHYPKQHQEDEDASSKAGGRFPDLLADVDDDQTSSSDNKVYYPSAPHNLWVVKDDMSNGAGGIWMLNPDNAIFFAEEATSPLSPDHRYVAQQYTWPPVLFGGKKCHVRVYGLLTADGRAYVHRQCFLHVANEDFDKNAGMDEDSVHITNCCANSHDAAKFAGEICADLLLQEPSTITDCGQPIVPLGMFFDSISASVALLAKRAFPFLRGGDANRGFEYLGMDFILSYDEHKTPVAYMLEVNAPPSQDTATGLSHAESLHNTVLSDLIHLWVLPSVTRGVLPKPGGWQRVHQEDPLTPTIPSSSSLTVTVSNISLPSKAVILNKIRWAIFERRNTKRDEVDASRSSLVFDGDDTSTDNKNNAFMTPTMIPGSMVARFARSQFLYYAPSNDNQGRRPPIFMESAGGAQVPQVVVDAMIKSLSNRHRSVNGALQKEKAREVAKTLLGCSTSNCQKSIYFGTNATTLLQLLAQRLSRDWQSHVEIVLCTENHEANTRPWIEAAERMGATIKWWSVKDHTSDLQSVLSPRTKLVALSHASNLLGQTRNLLEIGQLIQETCGENAQIVVDGVAAVPHVKVVLDDLPLNCWYAVSCHKLFGPHLGILCGPKSDTAAAELELGTVNYEACAGLIGLGEYFGRLATFSSKQAASQNTHSQKDRREATTSTSASEEFELTREHVLEAYRRIEIVEEVLVQRLLERFQKSSPKVHVLSSKCSSLSAPSSTSRLPIISFSHDSISSATIVTELSKRNVICREDNFKCSEKLQEEFGFGKITRLSLAHYNTVEEIEFVMNHLEELPGWY